MASIFRDKSHEFAAPRFRPAVAGRRSDHDRELDRRRRSLADGSRGLVDVAGAAGAQDGSAAGNDPIGRAVWESAEGARRLARTVILILDDDAPRSEALIDRSGRALMSASIAGLGLWAIALFLLGLE